MDEPTVSKPNRRRTQERRTHSVLQGQLPPSGLHRLQRREVDRRRSAAIRRARRAK